MLTGTGALLRSRFRAGMTTTSIYKRGQKNQAAVNHGNLTSSERGDPFSEPSVYRNTTNATVGAKLPRKMQAMQQQERLNKAVGQHRVTARRQMALDGGEAAPEGHGEASISSLMNHRDLAIGAFQKRATATDSGVSAQLISAARKDEYRRENMALKHSQAPSAKEYQKIFRNFADDAASDGKIDKIHSRLVEDHGVYPTSRMDAYMLDDESVFPAWVQQLPWSLRDRVKFGKMGLTEEDEALRVRLGRLPMDQRVREWERLKLAKEYQAATEERLSPTELRDARRGSKRFHWLQRKRQARATQLRRLALRRPDRFEAWPSDAVDYSRRLGVIAQHVENGVATHGRWPLDEEELAKAKLRKRQEDAERTFMKSAEERKMLRSSRMNGSVSETLRHMDKARGEKPFKRLSRQAYANRVNAVKHGDQDEYGRNYHQLSIKTNKRQQAFESISEIALHKEIRKEPSPARKSPNRPDREHWSRHEQENAYVEGLPSTRYGS